VAANDLGIVRPALSRHIKKIEDYAGTELFSRLPRGVRLTGAGEVFLGHCRRILQEVASAEATLRNNAAVECRNVALGITGPIAALAGEALIDKIGKEFPDVVVKLVAASSQTLITQLLDGFLDIALVVTGSIKAFHLPKVKLIPLFADPLFVVSAPQPGRAKAFYTKGDLTSAPIILNLSAGDLLRQQAPDLYKNLSIACDTDSDEITRSLVLHRKGVTLCPKRVFQRDLDQGLMAAFPISDIQVYVTLGLAYLEDRLSDELRKIVRIVKIGIDDLLARGIIASENPHCRTSTRGSGNSSAISGAH